MQAGTWPSMNGPATITPEMLEQVASTYDPKKHEAPAVIGHPQTDHPAWGWITAAEVRTDGLWLSGDLQPEFADAVRRKLYSKVSVSLYPPDAAANPYPGKYSLKHLGFLGAQPPAVKGLQAIGLSESDQAITINFSQEKEPDMTGPTTPPVQPAAPVAPATATTVQLSESDIQKRHEALQLAEQQFAEQQKEFNKKQLAARVEPHIQAGRVTPAQKDVVIRLMEQCQGQTLDLGEGQQKPLVDELDAFLAKIPPQVNLSEVVDTSQPLPELPRQDAKTPTGYTVSDESRKLDAKIKAHMKQHPGQTYLEAINFVEQGA